MQERIPEAARIIGFRNRLAHGYHSVRHEVVWEIVKADLPILRRQIAAIIA